MKFWKNIQFWMIVCVFGALSQLFAPQLWVNAGPHAQPVGIQIPFFLFLSIFESLAFGVAVAVLFFIFEPVKKLQKNLRTRFTRIFIALGWMLGSWWPHDNFHRVIGADMNKLLMIEYAFHVTLIIAAFIVLVDLVYLVTHINEKS